MLLKKCILFTFSPFFAIITFGQLKSNPKQFIGLNIGRSINVTGDMRGVLIILSIRRKFEKDFPGLLLFGVTLHDGSSDLFFTDPNGGEEIDGSIRYTNGGIQSTFGANYNFVQTARSEIYIGLNALLRYQYFLLR